MANRKKRTSTREQFLQALAVRGNVGEACKAAGVGRSTVYEWRETDQEFAAAWQEAVDDAIDRLEAEAWRRAFDGADRPVLYKGEITETFKEYSDRLMECLLRANRPEKYRERSQVELVGEGFAELLSEARNRRGK
jgi:hypothetical protein